jgi:hypothetical protein
MGDLKSSAQSQASGLAEQLGIPVVLPKAALLREQEVDVVFVLDSGAEANPVEPWSCADDKYRGFLLKQSLCLAEARALANAASDELVRLEGFEGRLHQVLQAGAIPIALHADNLCSLASVRQFARKFNRPGLVAFVTDSVGQGTMDNSAAETVLSAIDAGFDPANCVIAGLSGWAKRSPVYEQVMDLGVHAISLEEIWSDGLGTLSNRIITVSGKGAGAVLVSFDLRRMPSTAGDFCISSRDLFRLLQNLHRVPVRGIDLCQNNATTQAVDGSALPVIFEVLSQIAIREGKGRRHAPTAGSPYPRAVSS